MTMSTDAIVSLTRDDVDLHGRLERRVRSVAREIARDIIPIDTIFAIHGVTPAEWEMLVNTPMFGGMIREERELWGSSLSTRERVDLKTLVLVEQALPTMFELMNNKNEPAAARVAAFTAIQKGAGIGVQNTGMSEAGGGKVTININMGAGRELKVTQELPPQVIEGEVVDG